MGHTNNPQPHLLSLFFSFLFLSSLPVFTLPPLLASNRNTTYWTRLELDFIIKSVYCLNIFPHSESLALSA